MQLWNISTKKKIFEFNGWNSPISCCVSSPALDVVAIGCSDGRIHVHNIRYDEELVSFTHSTRGSVTALSFCTGRDGKLLLMHCTCCSDFIVDIMLLLKESVWFPSVLATYNFTMSFSFFYILITLIISIDSY